MTLPIVLARECLASGLGVVALWKSAMELLFLLVSVIDMPLQVRFRSETFAAVLVWAFVFLDVITLMVPSISS